VSGVRETTRWKFSTIRVIDKRLIARICYLSNLSSEILKDEALTHSKLHEITQNFAYTLPIVIRWFPFFFVRREPDDVSQLSSELTSEYLFDLTTSVAVPVPNPFCLRSFLHTTGNEDANGQWLR
jgi:hypothetical protein